MMAPVRTSTFVRGIVGRVESSRPDTLLQANRRVSKTRPDLRKHAPLDCIDFLAANLSTSLARLTVGRGSWSMV